MRNFWKILILPFALLIGILGVTMMIVGEKKEARKP
jgi:hypothetical protein